MRGGRGGARSCQRHVRNRWRSGTELHQRLQAIAPTLDGEGNTITPARVLQYDTLIIAVGSLTNDFGVPGVKQHAIALESPREAERFRRLLVNALIRAQTQAEPLRPGTR